MDGGYEGMGTGASVEVNEIVARVATDSKALCTLLCGSDCLVCEAASTC